MTKTDHTSQPLELDRMVWIALALVALLGLFQLWNAGDDAQTLNDFREFKPVIVRHEGTTHRFPALGITVTLPPGWTYLSVTGDSKATQATLVHPASHSILSFRPNRLDQWPPKGHSIEERAYANVRVQWVGLKVPHLIGMADNTGEVRIHSWNQFDHRRLGRLTHENAEAQGEADVIMIVISHERDAGLNQAIEDLCDSIEFSQPLS